MIQPLRQRVSDFMVRRHGIPPHVAEENVSTMPQREIRERFLMYVK
jgi:hypothetical protein